VYTRVGRKRLCQGQGQQGLQCTGILAAVWRESDRVVFDRWI